MCLLSGWSENKSYDWVCDLFSITSLTSFCNFPAQADFGFLLIERELRLLPFWWERLVTPRFNTFDLHATKLTSGLYPLLPTEITANTHGKIFK